MSARLRASRRRATDAAGARGRRGFSLVELIVAMILLSVGVMGLAGVSAYAIRQENSATQASTAALVAQSAMEQLRATRCDKIAAGGPKTIRGITASWKVLNVGVRTVTVQGTFSYTGRYGQTRTIQETTTILCVP